LGGHLLLDILVAPGHGGVGVAVGASTHLQCQKMRATDMVGSVEDCSPGRIQLWAMGLCQRSLIIASGGAQAGCAHTAEA
jgi:hypothetical protein